MAIAVSLSRHLKAIFYPGNLIDDGNNSVSKDKCMTVQHYAYQFSRSRDKAGLPTGQTNSGIVEFSVRLANPADGKVFYERLNYNESYSCTFLFNADFTLQKRLKDYEDAMVVKGYVVDVDDYYDSTPTADGSAEQELLTVKILVTSITYVGQNIERSRNLIIKQS